MVPQKDTDSSVRRNGFPLRQLLQTTQPHWSQSQASNLGLPRPAGISTDAHLDFLVLMSSAPRTLSQEPLWPSISLVLQTLGHHHIQLPSALCTLAH